MTTLLFRLPATTTTTTSTKLGVDEGGRSKAQQCTSHPLPIHLPLTFRLYAQGICENLCICVCVCVCGQSKPRWVFWASESRRDST